MVAAPKKDDAPPTTPKPIPLLKFNVVFARSDEGDQRKRIETEVEAHYMTVAGGDLCFWQDGFVSFAFSETSRWTSARRVSPGLAKE